MFKLSSTKVETTMMECIPLESYSKMMLCRCCPVRNGTNFRVVPEELSEGKLLRRIFGEESNQKVGKGSDQLEIVFLPFSIFLFSI